MKTSILVLSLILTSLAAIADDGEALIQETAHQFSKCSEVFPMKAILLGAFDDLESEAEVQALKDFLIRGSFAPTTLKKTSAFNQECLNVASGFVVGRLEALSEQYELKVHPSLVLRESTCIEKYQYQETLQPLFDDPANAKNKRAAESYLKTGEILPKEGQSDSSEAKTCGTMMNGSLVSAHLGLLIGMFDSVAAAFFGGLPGAIEALLSSEIKIKIGPQNDTEN